MTQNAGVHAKEGGGVISILCLNIVFLCSGV